MSFFENLLSSLSSVLDGDNPNYGTWVYNLTGKVDTVHECLGHMMGNSDRVGKIQDSLRSVQGSLLDLVPELEVEVFAGEQRNVVHQHQARIALLKLWSRILIVLDKITDNRYLASFLDVIAKVSTRSEFDCENVTTNYPHYYRDFSQYRNLMKQTYRYICSRLAEIKPLPLSTTFNYQMEIPRIFAKLLVVFYFRLPDVSSEILQCYKLSPESITYNLLDYEFSLPPNTEMIVEPDSTFFSLNSAVAPSMPSLSPPVASRNPNGRNSWSSPPPNTRRRGPRPALIKRNNDSDLV